MRKKKERIYAKKYTEFVAAGGARSGVFDISDKKTRAFVKKYKEFIPKKEIYKRNKKGALVAVDRRQRKADNAWLKRVKRSR